MPKSSTIERMKRLDLISARLKSDEALTVSGLSEEFGVSSRTLTRDIQLLRDQGLPIEADRGRGGGIRLHRTWGIGRVNFSYSEAIDLLVSLAIAEQMKSPFFMAELAPIRRKLLASFSPRLKDEISDIKSRILVGEAASHMVLSAFSEPRQPVVEVLHQAFVTRQLLEISYKSIEGRTTRRTMEPHYLLLHSPVWYVLAFDHLRQDIRTFRCDRIEKAKLQEARFNVIGIDQFKTTLKDLDVIAP
jgi:predicted DNA-binding transcriptional regulator YafY